MNKFKVGDKVTLTDTVSSVYLKHNKEYIVDKVFYDKLFVQGVDFKYDSNIFELVKESNMNKFKVGDKVVRVSETYGKAIKGGVYEVSDVSNKGSLFSYGINLKDHEVVGMGMFNYEASCFELYDDNILSPLEAAEAMLNGEDLLYLNYLNNWAEAGKSLDYSLKFLSKEKFKRKPKTVTINSVEVVAPIDTKSLGYPDKVWGLNLTRKSVYSSTGHTNEGLFWATEEDAQKALDAMLIPFKQ